MLISCDFYFLGIFRICSEGDRPAWEIYLQDMTNKEWKRYFKKTWISKWWKWSIRCKLIIK